MANAIQKYGSFTLESLDEEKKRVDAIAGGEFLKLEVGDTVLRFLPPPQGKNSPFRVTAVHYIDAVPGLDKMVVFTCPRMELKQPCIACERVEQLNRSKSPLDRERAWKIGAQLKIYANVIDRSNPDAGPRIFAFGKTVFEQLKKIRQNPRAGGDFTDPTQGGFDIIITREGTGAKDTRYTVSADRNNSPLSDDPREVAEWINGQHDLEKLINVEAPEALLAAWSDLARAHRQGGERELPSGGRQQMIDAGGGRQVEAAPKRGAAADSRKPIEIDPFDDET